MQKDIKILKIFLRASMLILVYAGNTKYRGSEIIDFMGKCLEEGVRLHHSSLVLQEAIHANKKDILNQ